MSVKTPTGLALAAAIAMFASMGNGATSAAAEAQPADVGAESAVKPTEFDAWRDRFRARALKAGIPHDVFKAALGEVRPNEKVHEKDADQPEFTRAIWDYLDGAVSETRVRNGRKMLMRHASALARAERAYGVPRRFLVAIWGMETSYGALLGSHNIFEALATLSYKGDRTAYGEEQLLAALKLVARGEKPAHAMKGSWAGAVGHTQFVPTTYLEYAVDGDKDGRRDLWDSLSDVFQSTANYLKASGFDPNLKWGREAFLPDDFDYGLAGYHETRPLSEWRAIGVKMTNGALVPDLDIEASVLVPAGHEGPAFLVYKNFHAILAYNRSTSYALAIGLLSDRINGGPSLKKSWPRHHRQLALKERVEIQQRLAALGYAPGTADGVLGRETRKAIRAFQKDQGDIADGYATDDLIAKLRTAKPRAAQDRVAEAPETEQPSPEETRIAEAADNLPAEEPAAESQVAAVEEAAPAGGSNADTKGPHDATPVAAADEAEEVVTAEVAAVTAEDADGGAAGGGDSGQENEVAIVPVSESRIEAAEPESTPEAAAPGGNVPPAAEMAEATEAAASQTNEITEKVEPTPVSAPDGMPLPRSKEDAIGRTAISVASGPVDAAALPRPKPVAAVTEAVPALPPRPLVELEARRGGVTAALAAPGLVILEGGIAAPLPRTQPLPVPAGAAANNAPDPAAGAIPVNNEAEPIISPPGTVYVGADDDANGETQEDEARAEDGQPKDSEEAPSPGPSGS